MESGFDGTRGMEPPTPPRDRRARPAGWVREGLVAGVLGYVSSLVLYSVINLVLERGLFFAARAFGGVLLGMETERLHPAVAILVYEGLRLGLLLLVGLGMSAAIRRIKRRPHLAVLSFAGGVAALLVSEGVLLLLARPVSAAHFWWVVVLANLVSGLAMSLYLIQGLILRELEEMAERLPL